MEQGLEEEIEEAEPAQELPAGGVAEDSVFFEGREEELAGVPADTTGAASDTTVGATGRLRFGEGAAGRPAATRRRSVADQSIVLLSLNSTPLQFDFQRKDQPKLVTERWRTNITSDLLRGVATNIEFDLFRGSGEDRDFSPFLSAVGASFGFGSSRGPGSIFGLGRSGRDQPLALGSSTQRLDSRNRLQSFDADDRFDGGRSGPWNVQIGYSLLRARSEEGGQESQSLSGSLSLQPTPKWRMRWTTQYNLTQGRFGGQIVTLERDLHRWQATFGFSKAPNGNFIFNFSVSLKDAPQLGFGSDGQGFL